jgi:hypothetical protein
MYFIQKKKVGEALVGGRYELWSAHMYGVDSIIPRLSNRVIEEKYQVAIVISDNHQYNFLSTLEVIYLAII